MAIIGLHNISMGFGGARIFDGINLQIEEGERIGLLGRNGSGKSTLLKLINGELEPQYGYVSRQQNLHSAYLAQEVPTQLRGNVFDIVAGGYHGAPSLPHEPHWQGQLQAEQAISRMELQGNWDFETLSAGMKRRVMLARGLILNPTVLLLDEPTNHLDVSSIHWLENFLKRWNGSLLFVTHDRVFLQKLATRIVELDRGRLFDWNCDYQTFLARREALLTSEAEQNALFDKKLAQEEVWIRKGIEARRTRNEGRVRALKRLREQRQERRERPGNVRMQVQEGGRSGKLVIEAENVYYGFDDKPVIKDFNISIQRGDKIGIIGKNGSGKTTLLRLLTGTLKPQNGMVEHGTNLKIAYFDQLRAQLDENKSVLDNVGQGRDSVTINGRVQNLNVYLENFLFPKERVNAPITALSGGERNRLLLARLFSQPANLLVLDEPTNDLDIETLEILEDLLLDFDGTLLIVSHDREFLNNVATSTLMLDGNGSVIETVGGYDDWQKSGSVEKNTQAQRKASPKNNPSAGEAAAKKAGYKEKRLMEQQKRELNELPKQIESLESEIHKLTADMADSSFYQQESAAITGTVERLKTLQEQLTSAYERWEELENMKLEE